MPLCAEPANHVYVYVCRYKTKKKYVPTDTGKINVANVTSRINSGVTQQRRKKSGKSRSGSDTKPSHLIIEGINYELSR
mgnify:FL=1